MMSEEITHSLRVLVADDDHSITKTFGWMLEILGYESRVAHNGNEAITVAQSFRPHVVLLDLNLSDMSGHQICEKMRAMPELENCIFIAQTGWDQPEHIERSRRAGFHEHWVKPVPMERLEKLLLSLSSKIAA
jgi:CheY-like chemotaxis protein